MFYFPDEDEKIEFRKRNGWLKEIVVDSKRDKKYYEDLCNKIQKQYDEGKLNCEEITTLLIRANNRAALYEARFKCSRMVIDNIAKILNLDEDKVYPIYHMGDYDDPKSNGLIKEILFWEDNHGDKQKLKKQVKELEAENQLLQKMLRGK